MHVKKLAQQVKNDLFHQITGKANNMGKEMVSFKNFENLVLHSLDTDHYHITVNSDVIREMFVSLIGDDPT